MTAAERRAIERTKLLLSSLRAAKHGAPPESEAEWWQQVQQLALDHGVAITYEQWRSVEPVRKEPQLL
jgi:hypothetical protein